MEYWIWCIAAIIFFVVIGVTNGRKQKKIRRKILKDKWGNLSEYELDDKEYEIIEYYFRNHEKKGTYIDDITWNDLSMDTIYERMNQTSSSIGNEYLYKMLRESSDSVEELKKRDAIMNFFASNEEARLDMQELFENIGNYSKISIYEYITRVKNINKKSALRHYIQAFLVLLSALLVLKGVMFGICGLVFMIGFNIFTYYQEKVNMDSWMGLFSYVIRANININDIIKVISKYNIEVLKEEKANLEKISKALKGIKRGALLLTSRSVTKDITDMIMDYVRMIFHVDIMKFYSVLNIMSKNEENLLLMYETIGYMDSLCATASFRETLDEWSKPELVKSLDIIYEAKDIYHPLIKKPVKNSINEKKAVLLTGSNASGKSTFIKTLAINALFSQTIYTSVSKSYKGCFFDIYSSMALKDDLFSSESYYIVEIKSLKRIMDADKSKVPVLCFVDEVLRGTNTLERIAASSQILLDLAKQGAMCFAATHDIELTQILDNYYNNYHFQEKVVENDVKFDYKLYKGAATSRNAIKLLGMIGYSSDVIEKAENSANKFLEDGIWEKI